MAGLEGPEIKTRASVKAFDRQYQEHGMEVSWAKHPPAVLTERFVAKVLSQTPTPLVYDLGCGEGGKAFYLAKYGIRVMGIDASSTAIRIAQHRSQELDLAGQVSFECRDLVDVKVAEMSTANGVHEYQCINHIAREYHTVIAALVAALLPAGGIFLTNTFCKDTDNFYGVDISKRENGEFIFNYDPNNPLHAGREGVNGMYCYFFKEEELVDLYAADFSVESIIKVPHPSIEGRVQLEGLMRKR